MNQLASDGPTAITAAEPVVFVSVDCRVMVRSDINAWTYSSFSYKENWSQVTLAINCQIQFVLDGPTAIKPVVLASLDNSLTQCGSVCPVRGGNQKVWDRTKSFVFTAIKKVS